MNTTTVNRIAPGALLPVFILAAALCGCASAPAPAPDTRAADEAAIRAADEAWIKAAQTLNPDAWMAFYSADAVVLPPNEKTASTHEAIRKSVAGLLGLPGLKISWTPTRIEVARAGDLAYLYGTYHLSMDGPKGKPPITDDGKILEIWKKQAGGDWKCIVDTWSSDLPPAPAN